MMLTFLIILLLAIAVSSFKDVHVTESKQAIVNYKLYIHDKWMDGWIMSAQKNLIKDF